MFQFLSEIKQRNEIMYHFGLICFIFALFCLVLTQVTTTQIDNVNVWYKPFKFSLSTMLYTWAMAWFIHYLPDYDPTWFNWSIIILLGFEIVYIAIQASRGERSHFNISTPIYNLLYMLMAFAASAVTIYTAYIGVLFFQNNVASLPEHYLWSIRAGIFIFVIFAFEGFLMGARMTHTIGGADGGESLPVVGWSRKFGDPRIAHFIGMHALQVLPILSYYLLKNTKLTLMAIILYAFLAVFTLVQALNGKPFLK
jgi:hypothetical protein